MPKLWPQCKEQPHDHHSLKLVGSLEVFREERVVTRRGRGGGGLAAKLL
jgi:hypothetical protein